MKDFVDTLYEGRTHFIGTLSLREIKKNTQYEIIDGQQRMTSLLLLLVAIIHSDKSKKQRLYMTKVGRDNKKPYLLKLGVKEDDEFLTSIIESKKIEPSTNSQTLMDDAYKRFEKEIKTKASNYNADELIEHLLNNIHFIPYLVDDESVAINLFSSINDRGLELAAFDKLKSFFIYFSGKNQDKSASEVVRGKINSSFKKIYEFFDNKDYVLGINKDERLLNLHYESSKYILNYYGEDEGNDVYQIIKNTIKLEKDGLSRISDYLDDILLFIKAVESIENKLKVDNKDNKYIEMFQILVPAERIYPFLIRLEIKRLLDKNIDIMIRINF